MLEGLVANLLNRFLGLYVKNFDATQLNVGIWSGDVKLRNLELKREALDQLHLPVDVVRGHLGQLTMSIPWTNLRGKPVKVDIRDVFLLAVPRMDADIDEEEERRRQTDLKLKKLENAELLKQRSSEGLSADEQQRSQTFVESVTAAIIDNLQISVQNIHIRYEDAIASPERPFALGFVLREFSAVSTDSAWTPSYIQSGSDVTHKLGVLDSLAVYWNTDANFFNINDESESLNNAFRPALSLTEGLQYILRPVSGRAEIEINKSARSSRPKTKARLVFEELGFELDHDQYHDSLLLIDLYHYFIRHLEYKRLQPRQSIRENPRAWLSFAFNAVRTKIHERNAQWSWAYIAERRDDRRRYIALFKMGKPLSAEDGKALESLEQKLSYEDLRFWRSLARNQLRKENIGVQKPPAKQTWTQWAFGANKPEEAADQTAMSDEQRKELYAAIDWDEKRSIAETVDVPREMVKYQVESELKSGQFVLKHGSNSPEILSVSFQQIQAKFLQRPDSFLCEFGLGSMRLTDGTTHDSQFRHMIDFRNKGHTEEAMFYAVFEHNPLDESADSALQLAVKSFELIYNPHLVSGLTAFFRPPQRQMESIGMLLETAGATVEGFRRQTRAGLEYALQEHKTINASFDIQAPLIIVPLDITSHESPCLMFDAGHVYLHSELIDRQTLRDLQNKHAQERLGTEEMQKLMYDRFMVQLTAMQIVLGQYAELSTMDDYIIDRTNMQFNLEMCIIPQDTTLTLTRIVGQLPVLKTSISDRKYHQLMQILDLISSFEERTSEKGHLDIMRPRSVSVGAHEYDSDDDEKPVVQKSSNRPMDQISFEFTFHVEKLEAALSKHLNAKDELLVLLIAEDFKFSFALRSLDISANVSLRNLSVLDHIDAKPGSRFHKMVYSSDEAENCSNGPLLQVKYVKVDRTSPEFSSLYENATTNLEVHIAHVGLIVTRKTLLVLLDFVTVTFSGDGRTSREQAVEGIVSEDIRIHAKLESTSMILNDDGDHLATLALYSGTLSVHLTQQGMAVGVKIGNLSLSESAHQLISIEGSNLLELDYQSFESDQNPTQISFESGSLRIVFLEAIWHRLTNFVFKFGKMKSILVTAQQAAAEQADQDTRFHFLIRTPILVFPHPGSADFVAKLGELYADNESQGEIQAGIRNISLFFESQDVVLDSANVNCRVICGSGSPTNVACTLSSSSFRLTQLQIQRLMMLLDTVPGTFSLDEKQIEMEARQEMLGPAKDEETVQAKIEQKAGDALSLTMSFTASTLAAELALDAGPNLCHIALNQIQVKAKILGNGDLESDLFVQSLIIKDNRPNDTNKFKKVLSLVNDAVERQFAANISVIARHTTMIFTVDGPRMVLAFDYLMALQNFLSEAMGKESAVAASSPDHPSTVSTSLRLNVLKPQVILIADSSSANSEAIFLGIDQVLLSQQNALTLQISQLGVYLCRMDRFEASRLRILDDFSLTASMEENSSIALDCEPIVLRLSLRDILLASQIVGRLSQMVPSGQVNEKKSVTSTKSEFILTILGIRLILIGDSHDLPLMDVDIPKFVVNAHDSNATTHLDPAINIFNFSKSSWEPLLEPWSLDVELRTLQGCLHVDLISRKVFELTLTSATISLFSKSAQYLQNETDVLARPRSSDAPYKMRNHTGFELHVWAEKGSRNVHVADGQECPWRFEDAVAMRQNLSPDGHSGLVGLRLEGSGFDSLDRVAVDREGEHLYTLKPKKDKILHRILVHVSVREDSVKHITFRSPLVVENKTQIPLEIGIFSPEEGHLLKVDRIAPGDERSAPVGAAFVHSLVVRPAEGFGYTWSRERLFWEDLLKRPIRTLSCAGDGDVFLFQMCTEYDKNDPLTGIYPVMRLSIYAPLEVQNLLPYDLKYRIYDKTTKKDWTNYLRKGGISPVHMVGLSHLLLLSVHVEETDFQQSDFAVVNSDPNDDLPQEHKLTLKNDQGRILTLKLHYFRQPRSGGAFRVSIYSPYVVLNKTGNQISIQSRGKMDMNSGHGTKPYMFSFPSEERKGRASIKIGQSMWSKPQSFDAIGSVSDVVVPSSSSQEELSVGLSIEEGEGKYNMSRIVTVAPRFVLKNKMSEELWVRTLGGSEPLTLASGQLCPLSFVPRSVEKQLSLCFPGSENRYSSPFSITNVGTIYVKIAKAHERQQLIRIDIIMEAATLFLHFSRETGHWPYSMRNESDVEFTFYQVREDEKPLRYRLPAKSIMPYAWDYPASKNRELVLVAQGRERRIRLAEIGNLVPLKIPAADGKGVRIVDLNIAADGPTQTLVLSNYKASKSLYQQKSQTDFEVKDLPMQMTFKFSLQFSGVGLSLVNVGLKELLYLTMRDIEVKYGDSAVYQTLSTTIKWIQIDNQLYGGIFPILLYPSVVPKTGKEMDAHPIFHMQITRVRDDSYGVIYIKYFSILLQQLTVELDEDFIFSLLDFIKVPGASWINSGPDQLCDENLTIPEPQKDQHDRDVYFELFHLQPMQLDLSFVRTEHVNAEDTATSANPFMFFVNVMTMSVGNVNDAPLRMNALLLENVRTSLPALATNVQNHYTQEFLRQIHIILGSADFLGNPVGLFNNISSGVADIFYEPYQGLVMSDRPQELGIGIAKGASSFVKKSVFGFSDSMAKFTGSMSKGLAAATLDKEYQDQRRRSKARNRPKHALYGVTAGGNAFASSLASGIGGLARHPLQGAEKEGIEGFVKGVGKGFLGLATKPAIGAFDLASNMAEGVRNTTTAFDQEGLDRVRLTRFIGQDGIVRPYAEREALGQFWLKTVDDGKFFKENYIAHLELDGKDMSIMLTYQRIMLVKMKKLRMEWNVKLNDVQTISKERTGMSITLKGGSNGPFIPVSDETSRIWLYRQIAVAVNAFNDKYRAQT